MRKRIIIAIVVATTMQGSVRGSQVSEFNKLIGDACQTTWVSLGKNAGWNLSQVRVSPDSNFTYETTPVNSFITCFALYGNEGSTDYGSWSVRFGTANPGENVVLKKLDTSSGNWEIVK